METMETDTQNVATESKTVAPVEATVAGKPAKAFLTVANIIHAAKAFHARHGRWPTQYGRVAEVSDLLGEMSWGGVNSAMRRRIPGGAEGLVDYVDALGSLPRLLVAYGVKPATTKAPREPRAPRSTKADKVAALEARVVVLEVSVSDLLAWRDATKAEAPAAKPAKALKVVRKDEE